LSQIQEAEIRNNPGEIVFKTFSQKNPSHTHKRAGGVGLEFKA
jgi:hypothetical protein